MRYIKPLKKVILTGTKAMLSSAMRHSVNNHASPPSNSKEYPILFMHGFMGFSERSVMNVKLFDYFNGVKTILEQMGYRVFTPSINPLASIQDRSNQWLGCIDDILEQTSSEKVHIIAHSQGAIDARVLATPIAHHCSTPHSGELYGQGYGDYIASITSIAGPHMGSPLADTSYDDEDNELMLDFVNFVAMMTGSTPKRARLTLDSLSHQYMTEVFNPAMKVPNSIPCYTVTGNPSGKKDISAMFDLTWQKIMDTALEDGGGENDGFVPLSSARFDSCNAKIPGTDRPQWQHLGDVKADHIALIGIPPESDSKTQFSHLPLFVGLAQQIDRCFIEHIQLALQNDGEWQRRSQTA